MIYEPSEDSSLLQKSIAKYAKKKSFLDMGAGNGIQSETALKAGAKSVLALDIQEDSIKLLKKKKISCRKSFLFSNIKKSEKYDLIAFNPPYLPQDDLEDKESRIITTGGKKGDEIILKFLKQAVNHLNFKGIILLLVSSLTPRDRIKKLLKKLKLEYVKIDETNLFMEKLEVWKIENRKDNNQ